MVAMRCKSCWSDHRLHNYNKFAFLEWVLLSVLMRSPLPVALLQLSVALKKVSSVFPLASKALLHLSGFFLSYAKFFPAKSALYVSWSQSVTFLPTPLMAQEVASFASQVLGLLQAVPSFATLPGTSFVWWHSCTSGCDIVALLTQGLSPLSILPSVLVEEFLQVDPWCTPDTLGVLALFEMLPPDVYGSSAPIASLCQYLALPVFFSILVCYVWRCLRACLLLLGMIPMDLCLGIPHL